LSAENSRGLHIFINTSKYYNKKILKLKG